MSALEGFKKVVKDSIASNKLSSSRVEAVKVAAAKCFDRAQPAKSEFLRLHLSAPAGSKVVSLYLFDAIARHAREVVKKNGAGLDPLKALPSTQGASDPNGTFVRAAKDFLGEMATIVEEVAVSTAGSVKVEQREKVDKVIDIWRKAGTFEADLLDRAALAAKRVASSSRIPSNGHSANGTSQGRSTTPTGSPPPALKRARIDRTDGEASGSATPPVPAGLPSSLAALLGAQAGASQGHGASPLAGASSGDTQSFMNSLSSLMGPAGASTSQQADASLSFGSAPAFDLSQLTALQQLASSSSTTTTTSGSTLPSTSSAVPLPPPGPPPPRPPQVAPSTSSSSLPANSAPASAPASTWPPNPDPSMGDLSSFDVLSFDPTQPQNWIPVAQKWCNSFGYMPALWEVGMNYLMVYRAALMQGRYGAGDGTDGTGGGGGGGWGDGSGQ
ncbi:hypothetical protein BCV69DRAFT_294242 [Microstroma glucosiphilum]|uniref:CID domain-containing protein n=1 Tax=Pseudomicrostroma glucosiphilum TaxID=1684307 RepID=A0A316U544_9BASI|nr:hypothetical protein BCV69DRAFT_294242 [Pseudomicrostroma glucosiphilum]PWN19954.1 hypothetical protein BCV69DRAFT_294242 [Pseudomicrostroma glucosiphilum]